MNLIYSFTGLKLTMLSLNLGKTICTAFFIPQDQALDSKYWKN